MLLVELSGTGPGASGAGLTIAASSSTIRGLVIDGFRGSDVASGSGITLQGGGRSIIAGNFLGTDPTGKISRGNTGFGVTLRIRRATRSAARAGRPQHHLWQWNGRSDLRRCRQ